MEEKRWTISAKRARKRLMIYGGERKVEDTERGQDNAFSILELERKELVKL
jgi:hypothetical protein